MILSILHNRAITYKWSSPVYKPYLESRSLETTISTVGSERGRNLHTIPNTEDRLGNKERWFTGHRSNLHTGRVKGLVL